MNDTSTISALDQAFIETAMRHMFDRGWFDVCTIDNIVKMRGCHPDPEAYKRLHLLHCVHWNTMPPAVLEALPDLIQRVIGGDAFNFEDLVRPKPPTQTIDITPAKRPRGLLRLLSRK